MDILDAWKAFCDTFDRATDTQAERVIALQGEKDKERVKERKARGKLVGQMVELKKAITKLSSSLIKLDNDLEKIGRS